MQTYLKNDNPNVVHFEFCVSWCPSQISQPKRLSSVVSHRSILTPSTATGWMEENPTYQQTIHLYLAGEWRAIGLPVIWHWNKGISIHWVGLLPLLLSQCSVNGSELFSCQRPGCNATSIPRSSLCESAKYEVRVIAQNSLGISTSDPFTFSVRDIGESPTFILQVLCHLSRVWLYSIFCCVSSAYTACV